jgi:hypothetical protein
MHPTIPTRLAYDFGFCNEHFVLLNRCIRLHTPLPPFPFTR